MFFQMLIFFASLETTPTYHTKHTILNDSRVCQKIGSLVVEVVIQLHLRMHISVGAHVDWLHVLVVVSWHLLSDMRTVNVHRLVLRHITLNRNLLNGCRIDRLHRNTILHVQRHILNIGRMLYGRRSNCHSLIHGRLIRNLLWRQVLRMHSHRSFCYNWLHGWYN